MALGEVFGGCDFINRGDLARDDLVHPVSCPRDGVEERVPSFSVKRSRVAGLMGHAPPAYALGSERNRQEIFCGEVACLDLKPVGVDSDARDMSLCDVAVGCVVGLIQLTPDRLEGAVALSQPQRDRARVLQVEGLPAHRHQLRACPGTS